MLALLYLGVAICVGERLCSRYFRFVSLAHRWATGTLVGLLLSTGFTYLAARQFAGTSNPLLWGNLVFFAAASIFLLNCRPKRDPSLVPVRVSGSETWDWVALGLYAALASWMMFATLDFKGGTLLIGVTQWSDYGPNTAIIQSFVHGHNFPAEYPHFAGEPIRYHFLFYFQAGNLTFLGLNLVWSLNFLSILTMVCMLAVIMALGELLFKSRAVGVLASALFFFHGTLSLVPFLRAQTSLKGALLAIYKQPSYLTSGYPYRGEDWGVWTQVVFINQRHLASSIGIFLIVLFFLLDRYLEWGRQKELVRASRAPAGPRRWPATARRALVAWIPARFVNRRSKRERPEVDVTGTAGQTPSLEQLPQASDLAPASEGRSSHAPEPFEGSSQVANFAPAGEGETLDLPTDDQQSPQGADIVSVSEANPSGTGESLEGLPPAANYASPDKAIPLDTRADDEQPPPELDSPVHNPQTHDTLESLEGPSEAANFVAASEAQTFHTQAYDEYMRRSPDPTSESEAQEAEALEFVKLSSQERETSPGADTQKGEAFPPSEPLSGESDARSISEELSSPAPGSETVEKSSRGMTAKLFHDNLHSGQGFIFAGLLLGALPYWNSPVFTAAFAVLAFFFVLFPYRRYMVGLAVMAGVVALPQVFSLRAGNARAGASLIHWGYTLGNVPISHVLKYLGFTFGVKWVLLLVGLIFGSWLHLRLFVAIFSLFLLTFCLQFSDEVLANHKFLNIWLVVANLFVAYGLWRLWHLRIKGWAIPSRLAAILLASPIVVGGIIDFFPIRNGNFVYTNFTNDRLIKWIQAETKPRAVFMTDKFVNHPILLAGRRIFFGYTYFTWSAGYDLPKREAAYRQMFESKNAHQVFTLLKANGIDYVAFDGAIRGFFKNNNEQQVYAPNFKKVFEGPEYWALTIYKVPENADFVPASSSPTASAQPTGVNVFESGLGKENGQFNFPRGLAVDNAGNIFVADTNNGRLQKFSPTGGFLSVIGKPGTGPGEFREPCGIAIDSSGNIFVADVSNHRIQKLKPDGTFLAQWKGPEPGFYGPRDLAIGPDNSIYVVDEGHSRIVKFDPNGKVVAVFGSPGKEDGQFVDATSIAVDGKNSKVYVADPRSKRLHVFDLNGKFLAKWIVEEWGTPAGWYFQDLVIDSQAGLLYASSNATDDVLVFDLSGKKVRSLKLEQSDRVVGAASLALTKNSLYVINTFAASVKRVDLGKK